MIYNNKEDIIQLTPLWEGERFPDGRPKVPDSVLERLKNITLEAAWGPIFKMGYTNQFEGDFTILHPDERMVGRAVTGVFMPQRPDMHEYLFKFGHDAGFVGNYNQWVIDSLVPGDVLVCDMYNKLAFGTFIGGNLATAIAARTKGGGAVLWGGVRDLEQIHHVPGLKLYYKGEDPTAIKDFMMIGMNVPCRIGKAVCLPGDVVFGSRSGVLFIPAHLAETAANAAEKAQIKDIFGFIRLQDGTYTTADIDRQWTLPIFEDWMNFIKTDSRGEPYRHLTWEDEREAAVKRTEELAKDKNSGDVVV